MKAAVGDQLVVKGHHVGEPDRDGEILGVGDEGDPPYTVRWSDNGHETIFFPGSDVQIHHFDHEHHTSPRNTD